MKSDTKVIIVISLIVICLLGYIGYYAADTYNQNKKETVALKVKTKKTTKKKTPKVEIIPKEEPKTYSEAFGKEVMIKVNDQEQVPFYILEEDDNTYTLISKNTLGTSSYYKTDDCDEITQSGCENITDELNITKFLQEKTQNWTNIGEIRIPNTQEIKDLITYQKASLYQNCSYWLLDDNTKDLAYYYDNNSRSILEDKVYNSHDVLVIIKVLKSYVS